MQETGADTTQTPSWGGQSLTKLLTRADSNYHPWSIYQVPGMGPNTSRCIILFQAHNGPGK